MRILGHFNSRRYGVVVVGLATYLAADGPLAVLLMSEEGARIMNLSVNMEPPDASESSRELPPDHFYVKTWDSAELVAEALASGLFLERLDMPQARAGFVHAPVWKLAQEPLTS